MHGRQKLPNRAFGLTVIFLFVLLFFVEHAVARELRRSMGFLRPYLMGDAQVAVADESSAIFYNPAAISRIPGGSTEFFNPQISGGELVKLALFDSKALTEKFSGITADNFEVLLGESIYMNVNARLPVAIMPQQGMAFGVTGEFIAYLEILKNPVLPGIRAEMYLDQIAFFSKSYRLNENLFIGFSPKVIQRTGIDTIITFGELFAGGDQVNLATHPIFSEALSGKVYSIPGVDVGLLYQIPDGGDWKPRLGFSALNIGKITEPFFTVQGMGFGDSSGDYPAGELKQLNTIGFAVSPTIDFIRYTMAVDYVDVTRTVIPGTSHTNRLRLGFEMGIGPRSDGTAILSLLAGLNATHPSFGLISRAAFFEVGFGGYEVERGDQPGDHPDKRFILVFGLRF